MEKLIPIKGAILIFKKAFISLETPIPVKEATLICKKKKKKKRAEKMNKKKKKRKK